MACNLLNQNNCEPEVLNGSTAAIRAFSEDARIALKSFEKQTEHEDR
jgi:hypothetical protein